MWAQHKYSVMARSPEEAGRFGRDLAVLGTRASMGDLAADLVGILRERPGEVPEMFQLIQQLAL